VQIPGSPEQAGFATELIEKTEDRMTVSIHMISVFSAAERFLAT
jgi:hypothetical protein